MTVRGEDLGALSFEELLEALEAITRQMAAGDIGIEAVADLYEEAGRLHAEASDRLDRVGRRIEGLAGEIEGPADGGDVGVGPKGQAEGRGQG